MADRQTALDSLTADEAAEIQTPRERRAELARLAAARGEQLRYAALMQSTPIPPKLWLIVPEICLSKKNPMQSADKKAIKDLAEKIANIKATIARCTPDAVRHFYKNGQRDALVKSAIAGTADTLPEHIWSREELDIEAKARMKILKETCRELERELFEIVAKACTALAPAIQAMGKKVEETQAEEYARYGFEPYVPPAPARAIEATAYRLLHIRTWTGVPDPRLVELFLKY